jgi:plastocyanin
MHSLLVLIALSQAPATECHILGTVSVIDNGRASERGAVVRVRRVDPATWKNKPNAPEFLQASQKFRPLLQVALVGDEVKFVNTDYKQHNVFSATEGQKFNLGTSTKNETGRQVFKNEGWVHLQCNIHSDMKADLLVVQNPWFTMLKPKEYAFKLPPLPAGKYEVVATEPNGASMAKTIACKGQERVTFKVEVAKPPKHKRADGSDYVEQYGPNGT